MRRIALTFFIGFIVMMVSYVPALIELYRQSVNTAHADVTTQGDGGGQPPAGDGGGQPPAGGGGGQPPGGGGADVKLTNPLLDKYNTLCKVLEGALQLITQLGAIVAVIFIIWTGFKFITAQGDVAKLKAAKTSFLNTIIGTAVLLGASVIAQIIVKTVFSITNKSGPDICTI